MGSPGKPALRPIAGKPAPTSLIVPTLRVGMPPRTLCVRFWDAERPLLHSHAERGNDQATPLDPVGAGLVWAAFRRWRQ
ncbi:hypothetical protein CUN61_08980 [Pseudomonas arsenicoxydans]|uniref:Uncharacterized protein n=1 Tax=Pseudomonas arsenicoxydans TaxID=702115 RepID=A0A4P6GF85_9PSED|nr:hypothetical protein CUN61_08980 [Pseudomonas arsenicoxydans]